MKMKRDRVSLRRNLSLKALNQKMSEDAINLTRALKGENKTAGNWGELILDQVLSASGLREGHGIRVSKASLVRRAPAYSLTLLFCCPMTSV